MTELKRLVLDYRTGELVVRCLYRTTSATLPGPNTKARRREVTELVREGLQRALEELQEGGVEVVGVSGFTVREDIFCTSREIAPTDEHKKLAKGA
jgi:hypothetical protein